MRMDKILKILISVLALLSFTQQNLMAQCDEELVEQAIKESGMDALFIREFKVEQGEIKFDIAQRSNNRKRLKLNRSRKSKASGVAVTRAVEVSKYNVRLHTGMQYRFNIVNDTSSQTRALLQLRKGNEVLGSTFDTEKREDIGHFNYFCQDGSQYQVLLSFLDGNPGCAVGILSVVINDSTVTEALLDSTKTNNVLYAGADNYIDIASTTNPKGSLEVSISRGKIEEEGGLYKINVSKEGPLVVDVTAIDSLGNVTEKFKSEFVVQDSRMPSVTFMGSTGGIISKIEILNSMAHISVNNWQWKNSYRLKMFTVAEHLSSNGISAINTSNLTTRQLNIIKDLDNGQTFYIKDIVLEDKKGQVYNLPPLGFIISD